MTFAREKYFSPPDFDLEIGTQFEESAASQEPGEASAPDLPNGPTSGSGDEEAVNPTPQTLNPEPSITP